jgi:hypothetical protein
VGGVMRSALGWLATLILIVLSAYTWGHMRVEADPAGPGFAPDQAKRARPAEKKSGDAPDDAGQPVTMAGPLAHSMKHPQDHSNTDQIESIEDRLAASDRMGGWVVSTGTIVLQKTFEVTSTMQLPFSLPARACNPQLHGSFRSYVEGGKLESDASRADIEFLVLNDEQYSHLLEGLPGNALFSAAAAHNQEVNARLPPTFDQPVTYHLVFRNQVRGARKKLVQADFRVDY